MILLPAETFGTSHNHINNLDRKPFLAQSQQEARDHRQPQQKPNMMDSLGKKPKLADRFIPCAYLIKDKLAKVCKVQISLAR